jgi:hypothetical protein
MDIFELFAVSIVITFTKWTSNDKRDDGKFNFVHLPDLTPKGDIGATWKTSLPRDGSRPAQGEQANQPPQRRFSSRTRESNPDRIEAVKAD